MSEDTYTLAEARLILQRQECTREGHAPAVHLVTISDSVGQWLCDCGSVTWSPS